MTLPTQVIRTPPAGYYTGVPPTEVRPTERALSPEVRLVRALAGLPRAQAAVLELVYRHDVTLAAIAAETGVSLGAVHRLASAALQSVGRCLSVLEPWDARQDRGGLDASPAA
ncbi:RNA polymerase sigma factor [Jatrophihabitans sp. GAS493]|uniref:RNA polymerase sigma factor n=1 Tax=Jatrophihabitans sp. GAS493 TaxID=1907575 RepID=UPI0012FE620A|nr:sigma factor-like helix-turn-helix DNA-binding protein [Jatrophihabitans sp. GAS493]